MSSLSGIISDGLRADFGVGPGAKMGADKGLGM